MTRPLLWAALLCASLTFNSCAGIRLELTHIDAKKKCTVEEHLRRATERTHRRLASMGGVTAPVHWAATQYIAEYLIGDPPQRAEAIIDTGSNLVWTQCSTCRPRCFSQNLSYYDSSQSRSFRSVACNDTACALGSETQCAADKKTCAVVTGYGSGNISGALDTETFTFGSKNVTLAFGCITASKFSPPGALNNASGIIGLGRGNLSLVKQLGDTKFSYCLTPYSSDAMNTSHLFVGASAGLSGDAPVTSVPFVKSPNEDPFSSFYYLPLAGITVGRAKLDVPAAAFDLRQVAPGYWAGTLIDSGTSFTSLVDVAHRALRAELEQQLGGSLVRPPAAASAIGADLCVAGGNISLVPNLTLHFGSGGGDVVMPPENYWAPVDTTTATACMVVFSSAEPNATLPMNETTVIGNYMQQNMHLLYDLGNGVLSFQTADCSSM